MFDGVKSRPADLFDGVAIGRILEETGCRHVIHAAGNTGRRRLRSPPEAAGRIHVTATGIAATAASRAGAALVGISTDHLWDGTRSFVDEETPPRPMNCYARTKRRGELAALAAHKDALILRTNFFGRGRPTFSDWIETELSQGRALTMFDDVFFTPIGMELLCPIVVEMAAREATGVYHAAGRGLISKYAFGVQLNMTAGYDPAMKAPRPKDMSLATGKIERFLGRPMPDCRESLQAQVSRRVEYGIDLH